MPDDTDKVYLPPGIRMSDVHDEYVKVWPDRKVTLNYFAKVYRRYFKRCTMEVRFLIILILLHILS